MKKQTMFVATLATAVAVAVAPTAQAATFTDITSYDAATQQEINALHSMGIINGTSATTFSPSRDIKRSQVVKILGRFLVQEGYATIPADALTKQRYSDLAVNGQDKELVQLAAVVKDYGIFNGSNGNLNPGGVMNRQNMVLVLSRLVDAVQKKENVLVSMAKGKPSNVTDLAKAKAETKDIIQAFNALGLSNTTTFNPNNNVKRSHFASFMYRIIDLLKQGETPTAVPGTYSPQDLGLQSITRIVDSTDLIGAKLTNGMLQVIQTTNVEPRDFFEDVEVEGKTLFGHTRTMQVDFYANNSGHVLLYDNEGSTVRVPAEAFKLDTVTNVAYTTANGAKDEDAVLHANGALVFTDAIGTNNIVTVTLKGTYGGQAVTRTVKYYFNRLGEIIFDTPRKNVSMSYHYEIADTGDVIMDGDILTGKKLYYFPVNDTLGWDLVSFSADWTIAQLQTLFGTDGSKEAIDFNKHEAMLIVDEDLTNYGVSALTFRDGFFTSYTQNVTLPFAIDIELIDAMGNVLAKRVDRNTIALTVIGPDINRIPIYIMAKGGREYEFSVQENNGVLSLQQLGDDW